jgi:hypothetical protein
MIGLDSIGLVSPDSGESTALEILRTGTGRLVAIFNDSISDTTGLITVLGGRARRIMIVPDSAQLTADDSLRLVVLGVDADSNSTFDVGNVSWSTIGAITGSFVPNDAVSAESTWFRPVRAGQGQVAAHSNTYNLDDTTGTIIVTVGDTAVLAIYPSGPETMYLRETREFWALGYDADGNFVDTIKADWDTIGVLHGTFTTFSDTPVLAYTTTLAGHGWIIASHGAMRDSVEVEVLPYSVDSIVIKNVNGAELGDTNWTTDNDSIELIAEGYDSTGIPLGRVSVAWSILDTAVGYFTGNNTSRVYLMLDRPGTAHIAIAYQTNRAYDTSGTIIVQPGRATDLVLTPDAQTMLVDDTLALSIAIHDADGNVTADYGTLTWSGGTRVGVLDSVDALHRRFVGTQLGADTIIVGSSYGPADTCLVRVIPRPDSFAVKVNKTDPYLREAVYCTLEVLDKFGNIIPGYDHALHRIVIETKVRANGVEQTPHGTVDLSGSGVVDEGVNGYITAGAVFDSGRLVVRLLYNVVGETLVVKFREDTTGIAGRSPGVVWLDPYLLSQVYLYPSPMDFNNTARLKIDYMLKYNSDVEVEIFGAEGSYVYRKSYRSGSSGGMRGSNRIEWDGRNRHGKNVGSGAYVVRIRVECKEGTMEKRYKIGIAGRK